MFLLKNYQARIKWLILLFLLALGVVAIMLSQLSSPLYVFHKNEDHPIDKEKISLDIPNKAFSSLSVLSFEEFLPDFSNKMKIWLHEPRPDAEVKDKNLGVMLLCDRKSRVISSGERLYLFYDNGYKFSESPTNFWVVISQKAPTIAKVNIGARYKDQNNNICEKEKSFEIATSEQDVKETELKDFEGFLSLKNAIFLGPDLFLDFCEKDNEKSQLNRLVFPSKETCFVKKGDFLIFKDERWQVSQNMDTMDYSLSRISSLNAGNLDIDFWKKGDASRIKIKLNKPTQGTALHITDDFISELSIRTKKQVSCKIQGQRIILKEKDFLYKKDGVWKKAVLNDFEKREDISEFFLFDKLELSPLTKNVVGYLFNHDKTQMVKVEKKIVKKLSDVQSDKGSNTSTRQIKKRR